MKIGILAAENSPWVPGVIEAIAREHTNLEVVLFRPMRDLGYTDVVAQAIDTRYHDLMNLGVPIDTFLPKTGASRQYVELAKFIRNRWPKGIDHLVTLYGGGFAFAAWLSKLRPYSVYAVGSDVLRPGRAGRLIGKKSLANAENIFCNGQHLVDAVREWVPGANAQNLLLGINTDQFTAPARQDDEIRIVCPRGFLPIYDNMTIIRALTHIKSDRNWKAIFLAQGPELEEAQRVWATSCQPGTEARVEFRGGCSLDQVINELEQGHIMVSMSTSDGTSTALLEALSCGLTPILSDIHANRDWVKKGGALVPLKNVKALTLALEQALSKGAPHELRQARHAWIREVADSRVNMRKLLQEVAGAAAESA